MVRFLSIVNGWGKRQVDFFLSFPHPDIKFDMFMDIPQGIETKGGISTTHVLKILNNLYGHMQGYWVWSHHLIKGLEETGFIQSRVDD